MYSRVPNRRNDYINQHGVKKLTQIKSVMVSIINMASKNDPNKVRYGFNNQHGVKK